MDDYIGIYKTYRITAREYLAKHKPTLIGTTVIGRWYEHPVHGDEVGLLVVPAGTDRIHWSRWMDVPTEEELGLTYKSA